MGAVTVDRLMLRMMKMFGVSAGEGPRAGRVAFWPLACPHRRLQGSGRGNDESGLDTLNLRYLWGIQMGCHTRYTSLKLYTKFMKIK